MLQPILDRELAICTDGRTFEFSALTGRYLRPLEYMSASWLLANIDAIFPASKENFFAAATGALYGNVDPALYSLLSEHRVIERMLRERSMLKGVGERAVEWVGLGYLWGIEQLDSLPFSILAADEDAKGLSDLAAIFWRMRKQITDSDLVEKIGRFWEWCDANAKEASAVLSSLGLLASYVERLDDRARKLLERVAPFAQDNHRGFFFFEQLDRLADEDPRVAGGLLKRAVERKPPDYDLHQHLGSILRKLAKSGHVGEARVVADKLRHIQGMVQLNEELKGLSGTTS